MTGTVYLFDNQDVLKEKAVLDDTDAPENLFDQVFRMMSSAGFCTFRRGFACFFCCF